MNFLPIVERELRVTARRRSTYWLRAVAAAVVVAIAGGFLVVALLPTQSSFVLGPLSFQILKWVNFAILFFAGPLFTADCLSEERRASSLDLLFLSALRGYDVVLGKLVATSLSAFQVFLAMVPALALPLLLGGVTAPEIWKTALALVNTLLVSLAAGMMISSVSRDSGKAVSATVVLLLLVMALPLGLDYVLWGVPGGGFSPGFSYASAGFAVYAARSLVPGTFWPSLAASHAVAWLFLGLASCFVFRQSAFPLPVGHSREWQSSKPWTRRLKGRPRPSRLRPLMGNPITWLVSRGQTPAFNLILLGFSLLVWVAFWPLQRGKYREWLQLGSVILSILNIVFYWSMVRQASRFPLEARRDGTLELLLCTPLTIRHLISGQWDALRRSFLVPVGLALVAHAWIRSETVLDYVLTYGSMTTLPNVNVYELPFQISVQLVQTVLVVADLIALGWVGMWMGLCSLKSSLAILKTVTLVLIVPHLLFTLGEIGRQLLNPGTSESFLAASLPHVFTDAGLSLWASWKLRSGFRAAAARI